MTRSTFRRAALALMAAPLALGLAACGDKTETPAATSGEPIAKIAPPAGQSWAEKIVKTPEGGYRMGNPDAPIKLIEFGALTCSHCAEFAKESFEPLRDNYVASGRVSYELRLFMLNAYDVPAAMLATCGSTEAVIPLSEQFWAWQPEMFAKLQAAGEAQLQAAGSLPPAQRFGALAELGGMTDFFASRGIAKDQAAACLADTAKATALANETQAAAEKYNVSGTPTFFINGESTGTADWHTLEPKLQAAGAR